MMRHFGNRIDSDYGTSLIAIQPEPSRSPCSPCQPLVVNIRLSH